MLSASVALQRIFKEFKVFRLPKYLGTVQFANWVRNGPDPRKDQIRIMYTCLRMKKRIKKDLELESAFYTRKSDRDRKCRQQARAKAKRCFGSYSSSKVIHHVDGNACNNRCGNLKLLTRTAHRKIHRKQDQYHSACEAFSKRVRNII